MEYYRRAEAQAVVMLVMIYFMMPSISLNTWAYNGRVKKLEDCSCNPMGADLFAL